MDINEWVLINLAKVRENGVLVPYLKAQTLNKDKRTAFITVPITVLRAAGCIEAEGWDQRRDWRTHDGHGRPWAATAYWRCSVCGGEFKPADFIPGNPQQVCAGCLGPEAVADMVRVAYDRASKTVTGSPFLRPQLPPEAG